MDGRVIKCIRCVSHVQVGGGILSCCSLHHTMQSSSYGCVPCTNWPLLHKDRLMQLTHELACMVAVRVETGDWERGGMDFFSMPGGSMPGAAHTQRHLDKSPKYYT